jgi:glutaredoxin 3
MTRASVLAAVKSGLTVVAMTRTVPVLYLKPGCPWCDDVVDFLKARNIPYNPIIVSRDRRAMQEMIDISGQSKAPTMNWDGEILADFGVEELVPFLKERGVAT